MEASTSRLRVQAAAAMRLKQLADAERYKGDPWAFMGDRLMLLDPLRPADPIRPFPAHLDYLRMIVSEWEAYPRTITWKPRRMRISWLGLGYAVAKAATLAHQRVFLIAKKEGETDVEGARELLWRSGFLCAHAKPAAIPVEPGKLFLRFPETGSTISAVSSEPNQMRQVSATLVIGDEFAFWEHPEESLAALLPTLEREGRFVGITTSRAGYFQRLIYDCADADDALPLGPPHTGRRVTEFPGFTPDQLQAWTNPRNGFRIIDLKLGADPELRSPDAINAHLAGIPPTIREQEYFKVFAIRAGRAVFEQEFREALMVRDALPLVNGSPLLVGLDFGYTRPAAVVAQIIDGLQLRLYRCALGERVMLKHFIRTLLAKLEDWFPSWPGEVQWCCDIAGNRTQGQDEPEMTILRREFGIACRARYAKVPASVERLREFLTGLYKGEPGLMIQRCAETRMLVEAFRHGYRYPKPTAAHPTVEQPEKDGFYDHVMDATRYLVENFGGAHLKGASRSQLLAVAQRDIPERWRARVRF